MSTDEIVINVQQLDLAFINGSVFDGLSAAPASMSVGVRDGIIVTLDAEQVTAGITPTTRVVDLTGRLLLPGFVDAHVHPVEGGVERLGCDLSSGSTREDYLDLISEYVSTHPDLDWIIGGGWQQAAFPGGNPHLRDLDAISAVTPMIISNRDHHSAWVNSAVLRMAGIDKDFPDPIDGRIERDAQGNPTGTLHEGARMLALRLAPAQTKERSYDGLLEAQRYLHSFGITGWQDALIGDYGNHSADIVDAYQEAIDRDTLRARVNGAIWWEREQDESQIEKVLALRERFQHELFRVTTVKIMQDGVTENMTAGMTSPYMVAGDSCASSESGLSFLEPEKLNDYVTLIDSHGLQVHFHAIGDRAVRESLDAVAASRQQNGDSGTTHHIAHVQIIHPDDLSRFAPLGVAANIQALWASNDPQMVVLNLPILGEARTSWQYPFASLLSAGAQLCAGSDWPVTSPDPWLGIHVAVNRQHPVGHPDFNAEVFVPEERITLDAALRAYTSDSARINNRGNYTGAIREGYVADLVVVDRNPFDHPSAEIGATTTVETFFAGESVYVA
jgi:predicted amidohydrolase YtcJ